jgi:hypothetical protein
MLRACTAIVLPVGGYSQEWALVRPAHREAGGDLRRLDYHLFERPLDVREPPSHHGDDGQVAFRPR